MARIAHKAREDKHNMEQDKSRIEQDEPTEPKAETAPQPLPPGWSIPEPRELPKPTYWPVVMSVGITFILWGVVTSLIVSGFGLVLFALALAGWIGDIRQEDKHE